MSQTTPTSGVRPLLRVGTAEFLRWAETVPEGHTLLLGDGAAIHRVGCDVLAAAGGRPAVCSPDTLALEFAMHRFTGRVAACESCAPVLDVPASEFEVGAPLL
jgi:hypothetical protein